MTKSHRMVFRVNDQMYAYLCKHPMVFSKLMRRIIRQYMEANPLGDDFTQAHNLTSDLVKSDKELSDQSVTQNNNPLSINSGATSEHDAENKKL